MPKPDKVQLEHEEYMGDGLYAGFDGYYLYLRAERDDGIHWVALEPDVYCAFLEYSRRQWKKAEKARE